MGFEQIKRRQSSLELLRIIAMIMIVSHHYVVNSGLENLYDYNNVNFNMIFLQFFGWGGKTAINIFVLISSYFLCKSKLTYKKVLKLYLQIKFYSWSAYLVFALTGYTPFSITHFIKTVFNIAYNINVSFTGSFLAFYILIPFLNRAVQGFSKKTHRNLCAICIFLFTMISTFSLANDTWNYIGWYITLYLVASYIRFYPNKATETKKYAGIILALSLFFVYLSILMVDFVGVKFGFTNIYYMVSDSHKLLALTCSVSVFILFKNLNVKYNKNINRIASFTFGIFLIHSRGDSMRKFVWVDIFENTSFYNSSLLPLHACLAVVVIFIVGSIVDYLRITLLEKPLMKKVDKIEFLNKECFVDDGNNV